MTRPIATIAADISRDWKKVNYAAVPYLRAMSCLNTRSDKYGEDDAIGIIVYFLANATSWRGVTAKAIKAELRDIVHAP